MTFHPSLSEFFLTLEESLSGNTFVKTQLGGYNGPETNLKSLHVRRIRVKHTDKLSFTYRYRNRDVVKNYAPDEALHKLRDYMTEGFQTALLCTSAFDLMFERGQLKRKPASQTEIPSTDHDRAKTRLVPAGAQAYLQALRITGPDGAVLKSSQDKYRQINKYIEILSGLIKEIPPVPCLKIADMGSGKGYLTFALFDYLRSTKTEARVTGIEFREDLVHFCNQVARDSNFDGLTFQKGVIADYDPSGTNILIALHACDTATDDALYKGIMAGADLIVAAPCCHKQIRRELESAPRHHDLDFLLKHGIFMERQAEMVTDGLRALLLEYCGYSTKVFEFISDSHTPKNVLIVGQRRKFPGFRDADVLNRIQAAKAYFGIRHHHLESLILAAPV